MQNHFRRGCLESPLHLLWSSQTTNTLFMVNNDEVAVTERSNTSLASLQWGKNIRLPARWRQKWIWTQRTGQVWVPYSPSLGNLSHRQKIWVPWPCFIIKLSDLNCSLTVWLIVRTHVACAFQRSWLVGAVSPLWWFFGDQKEPCAASLAPSVTRSLRQLHHDFSNFLSSSSCNRLGKAFRF